MIMLYHSGTGELATVGPTVKSALASLTQMTGWEYEEVEWGDHVIAMRFEDPSLDNGWLTNAYERGEYVGMFAAIGDEVRVI